MTSSSLFSPPLSYSLSLLFNYLCRALDLFKMLILILQFLDGVLESAVVLSSQVETQLLLDGLHFEKLKYIYNITLLSIRFFGRILTSSVLYLDYRSWTLN